jgi:two-component system chemotaxis response regulator CheY
MSLAVAVVKRAVAIDDSRTVLASVRHALEQLGFQVITATDPSQLSPEQVQEAHLIVVDVNMEEVFGDDVVSFLRESWQVRAPIFLYSSLPLSELEKRAKGAGADGAVCKGDGVAALVARVRHLAGGA